MKTTFKSLFILLLAAFTFACEQEPVHVSRVNLDFDTYTLVVQETFQLTATVSPSNAANSLIRWSSTNGDVASVNQGLVTALAPGDTWIIATSDEYGYSDMCHVFVNSPDASSITLDVSELTLHELEQYILKPSLVPDNANTKSLVWSSSNTEVAAVSAGVVHALKAGSAVITVSGENNVMAECAVTVVCDLLGVRLEDHDFSMKIGETIKLGSLVHVYPDRASDKSVTWSSSDTRVATVSEAGDVTAVSSGTAEIRVTSVANAELYDVCTVEVDIADMVLNATSLDMVVEDTFDLVASEPSGVPVEGVSWTTTNAEVASVDGSGHVVALSAGSAVICATTQKGGHHAFCTVSVRNKVDEITMSQSSADLLIGGGDLALSVELVPKEAADYVTIVWASSDETVATVDQSGKVTPLSSGTAVITASTTDGKVSDKCTVTVTQPVTSISLSPETQVLWTNGEPNVGTVTVTLGPDNAEDKSFNADYSNTASRSIVRFSISGQTITVEPLKAGMAKIDVAPAVRIDFHLYKSFVVEVRTHVESVSIDGEESRLMNVGETLDLKATVLPADASDKNIKSWGSDNTDVATVDSNGKVTAKAPGDAVITVTTIDGEKTASCKVTVAQPVTGVTLDRTSLTFTEGDPSQTLVAAVLPKEADQGVTWSSSNTSVATVEDGTVTAVAAGSAVITATSTADSEKKATCTVTVNAKIIHVSSVTLSPNTLELTVGESKEIKVTVGPSNISPGVSRLLFWRSNNNSVATVDNYGKVTAVSAGTATIRCISEDNEEAFDECVVTVSLPPVPVESITLSKTSATIGYGDVLRLEATVLPDDATNKEIEWTSSNTAVATVDQTGLVTALRKTGTAVITAKSVDNPTILAECSISVISQVVAPSGISIIPRNFSIYVGQTKKIQGTVSPSNATDKTISWEPAGGTYVIVTNVVMSNGTSTAYIQGAKPGNTNVSAWTAGREYSTTARITVSVNDVGSIELSNPNGITLKVGEEFDLTATPYGVDRDADPSYPTLRWSASGGVVAVTHTGHVVATKAGKGVITVSSTNNTNGNVSVTCPVTVIDGGASDNGHEGVGFEDWNF